jgi:hypothetical protein
LFQGSLRNDERCSIGQFQTSTERAVFADLGLEMAARHFHWTHHQARADTDFGRWRSCGAGAGLSQVGAVALDELSWLTATERLLERAVTRLLDGRTGVIIAHRLATVERADRIMILANGQVVEFGARAELVSDPDSHFARLLRVGMAEALA